MKSVTPLPGGRPLHEIETWIFDLDNTLYPASCNLFREVEQRMAAFISAELNIDSEAAHKMRRHFFTTHGTTLRGLMLEYDIEPDRFLEYVHEIDLSNVLPDPALVAAMAALPGRKLVFTNATRPYAEKILARIGLETHMEAIHDIVASEYLPKPNAAPYRTMLAQLGVEPHTAIFFEDTARNLEPAAALGMTTAWVRSPLEWAQIGADGPHVHHVIEDLAPWLRAAAIRPVVAGD